MRELNGQPCVSRWESTPEIEQREDMCSISNRQGLYKLQFYVNDDSPAICFVFILLL